MRRPNDTRTIGQKIAGAISRMVRGFASIVGLVLIVVVCLAVPVGMIYVVVHFVLRYW